MTEGEYSIRAESNNRLEMMSRSIKIAVIVAVVIAILFGSFILGYLARVPNTRIYADRMDAINYHLGVVRWRAKMPERFQGSPTDISIFYQADGVEKELLSRQLTGCRINHVELLLEFDEEVVMCSLHIYCRSQVSRFKTVNGDPFRNAIRRTTVKAGRQAEWKNREVLLSTFSGNSGDTGEIDTASCHGEECIIIEFSSLDLSRELNSQ